MTSTTPAYRSATEYRLQEGQGDEITRIAAYHRKDYGLSVIWFPSREHDEIRPSISTPFQRDPRKGLGALGWLPLELLHDVLARLDMRSLFSFRQANLRSRRTVDSLRQYQLVTSHGLNLLCALLRTRVAADISLSEFYHALCTKDCAFCGEFGSFMALLTWDRCCFKCLQGAVGPRMQTLATARKQFNLSRTQLAQLRSFKTLPGTYSMKESMHRSRFTIVSVYQAMLVAGEDPQTLATKPRPDEKFTFMGCCALPYYDRRTGTTEQGLSCAGCQVALEKEIIGSRGETWAFEARDKVYSFDGFLDHFKWCEQAQLLWESSDQGKHQPVELPEAARRGGFFNTRE